jgi:hypothetical protein
MDVFPERWHNMEKILYYIATIGVQSPSHKEGGYKSKSIRNYVGLFLTDLLLGSKSR